VAGVTPLPSALELTVLGCSGTFAAPDNACSGYLLRTPEVNVWLDAGPGTLANLQRHIGLDSLDAVVLSHEHPDHWLELPVLRNALKYVFELDELPVHGPAGILALARPLVGDDLAPTFDWHTIADGDRLVIGDLSFTFARTDHPVETLASRIEWRDRVLVYSADTGSAFDAAPLAGPGTGTDLALLEATGSADVHLTGPQAGDLATRLGARRLLVTHLLPGCDADERCREVATTYGGPIEPAEVGRTYLV
jgi:ribonuclease BN (tRNA processing enzyme)